MVRVNSNGLTIHHTMVNLLKIIYMVKESIYGKMDVYLKVLIEII